MLTAAVVLGVLAVVAAITVRLARTRRDRTVYVSARWMDAHGERDMRK